MNEVMAPDMLIGALACVLAFFYAARHEYKARNPRDAKLLAAAGLASLAACAAL